ncbi:MAG: ArsR family transcriptional regulator [Candidatus Thermoplasmatota archaeon]|nr:ArsR family transcriptional regulator [Candidatus Thermoplasmatota archaeon]
MTQESNLFKELKETLEPVKRHIRIIEALMNDQPAGIIKISQSTGMPDHKIRYSLRILEKDGIITPSKDGAILTPEFIENKDRILAEAKEILDSFEDLYSEIKKSFTGKK